MTSSLEHAPFVDAVAVGGFRNRLLVGLHRSNGGNGEIRGDERSEVGGVLITRKGAVRAHRRVMQRLHGIPHASLVGRAHKTWRAAHQHRNGNNHEGGGS